MRINAKQKLFSLIFLTFLKGFVNTISFMCCIQKMASLNSNVSFIRVVNNNKKISLEPVKNKPILIIPKSLAIKGPIFSHQRLELALIAVSRSNNFLSI